MKLPSKDFFDFDIYNIDKAAVPITELKQQNLSIIVLGEQIGEEELELLYKIMGAIDKQLDRDFVLLNIREEEEVPDFKSLAQAIGERKTLLVFGVHPARMGLHIEAKPYQSILFQSHQLLFAHTLTDIAANVNYKKQLWGQLQQLFK